MFPAPDPSRTPANLRPAPIPGEPVQPDRPVQTTLAFHSSRIVTDVGGLLAMASMSMPFITSPAGDRSALDADAFPALILLLPIFAVTFIPDHTRPLHPAFGWTSLALGLAALPYASVKMLDAAILADTLNGSVGLGARLLVVGCLVAVVGIGIGLYRNLRGLPAGGTPGRDTAFGTGSKTAAASPTEPIDPPDEAQDVTVPASTSGPDDAATPPPPTEPPPSGAKPDKQPEIVFPDTGAVAREAEPDHISPEDPSTTAERADAALDDHLLSLFDRDEPDGPEGSDT